MTSDKPGAKDERLVEYVPLGCTDKIKLSVRIVQNLLAVPTTSGKTCSERDALKFIMLCSARKLNPFEGDAFLVGYDGRNGPEFSLITAHQALLKRAEVHPQFDGMTSGVIVKEGDALKDLEGDFHTEDQVLVGAWAKVFFKERKVPSNERIALKPFIKTTKDGTPTKFWRENPAGMLVKCAEAGALRKAFPTMCGSLYLREEISLLGEGIGVIPTPDLTSAASASPAAETPKGNEDDSNPELAPEAGRPGAQTGSPESPQAKLAALAAEAGCDFNAYQRWAKDTGNDREADSRSSWSEVPEEMAKRFLRSPGGFVGGLKKFQKGGGQ
jgi:phage recombination protein Bet